MSVNLALVGGGTPKVTGKPADRGNDEAKAGRGFDDALADAGRDRPSGIGRKDATSASGAGAAQGGARGSSYDTTGKSRGAANDADAGTEEFALDATPQAVAAGADQTDPVAGTERAGSTGETAPDGADAVPPAAGTEATTGERAGADAARQTLAMLEAFITAPREPGRAVTAETGDPAQEPDQRAPRHDAHPGRAAWNIGIASGMSALHMPVGNERSILAGDARKAIAAAPTAGPHGRAAAQDTGLPRSVRHASTPPDGTRAGVQSIPAALADTPPAEGKPGGFQSISAALAGSAQAEGKPGGLQPIPGSPAALASQDANAAGRAPAGETQPPAGSENVDDRRARRTDERAQPDPVRFKSDRTTPMADDGKASARTPDAIAGRVNVVSFSPALAPPAAQNPALGNTAAGLVAAFEAEPSWRAAAEAGRPATQRSQMSPQGVNTLRIQLQPAELGMVTARLTAAGSQLSIEIQVESNDARQRLANDSDAIVKALRGIGYDIDKVTIQQASQPSTGSAAQSGASARDHAFAEQQGRGEADARGQGGRGSDGRGGEGARHGPAEAAAQRAGSGVYI